MPLFNVLYDTDDIVNESLEEIDGGNSFRNSSELVHSQVLEDYMPTPEYSYSYTSEKADITDLMLEMPESSESPESRRMSFLENDKLTGFQSKRKRSIQANPEGLESETLGRKVRKSTLVEDFVSVFEKGDPEYMEMINMHLIPYCSLNELDPDLFVGHLQNKRDHLWAYEINKKSNITSNRLVRFANHDNVNFYEPRVFRYLRTKNTCKRHKREGLCSFCKPTKQDYQNDFNNLFFDLNSSGYLHHLTKQHGVFSNGSEMPLPKLIGLHPELKSNKTSAKIGHVYVAVCPICNEKVKVQDLSPESQVSGNRFLAYFRHMLTHNVKKNSGKGR
ncbi:hypothetical protein HPODL_00234 [Ogataea parapolymorpha DL-1]|uniref:Transcription regulator Rua1 C-terminal domain-containing protein n=1 Tax=Ogataea parapolymorpha (strain ATCC 26012 / BCRC 20466 / JCM 22074 / NRRL Y-7560 / DL-1) TaxID=871575 RepID=W1QIM2_OGAPD|nr:hypothetical protein HPODL_00234 [Ogataea parapolymorpha DL-1]ESX00819.1 hypothetical protein HPODL_00234 [Ogataea parapolymorpha DL-1]